MGGFEIGDINIINIIKITPRIIGSDFGYGKEFDVVPGSHYNITHCTDYKGDLYIHVDGSIYIYTPDLIVIANAHKMNVSIQIHNAKENDYIMLADTDLQIHIAKDCPPDISDNNIMREGSVGVNGFLFPTNDSEVAVEAVVASAVAEEFAVEAVVASAVAEEVAVEAVVASAVAEEVAVVAEDAIAVAVEAVMASAVVEEVAVEAVEEAVAADVISEDVIAVAVEAKAEAEDVADAALAESTTQEAVVEAARADALDDDAKAAAHAAAQIENTELRTNLGKQTSETKLFLLYSYEDIEQFKHTDIIPLKLKQTEYFESEAFRMLTADDLPKCKNIGFVSPNALNHILQYYRSLDEFISSLTQINVIVPLYNMIGTFQHAMGHGEAFGIVWEYLVQQLNCKLECDYTDKIVMFYKNAWVAPYETVVGYLDFIKRAFQLTDECPQHIKTLLYSDSLYRGSLYGEKCMDKFGFPWYPLHPFIFERLICLYRYILGQNTHKTFITKQFNWRIYRELNPDLINANLDTKEQILQHWDEKGYRENRSIRIIDLIPDFNLEKYKNVNFEDPIEYEIHCIRSYHSDHQ